jgi:hypothetical protein
VDLEDFMEMLDLADFSILFGFNKGIEMPPISGEHSLN